MSEYPEHDKLRAISDQSQAVGEFLEWLRDGGLDEQTAVRKREFYGRMELAFRQEYELAGETVRGADLMPLNWPVQKILAAYFGIDQETIEREKRAMLAELGAA